MVNLLPPDQTIPLPLRVHALVLAGALASLAIDAAACYAMYRLFGINTALAAIAGSYLGRKYRTILARVYRCDEDHWHIEPRARSRS